MGFRANGGFALQRKRKNSYEKKGFGANGGFGCTKEERELIVGKYEEKRGGLGSTVDLKKKKNNFLRPK